MNGIHSDTLFLLTTIQSYVEGEAQGLFCLFEGDDTFTGSDQDAFTPAGFGTETYVFGIVMSQDVILDFEVGAGRLPDPQPKTPHAILC